MSNYMTFEGFRIKKLHYTVNDNNQSNGTNEKELLVKFNIGYRNPETANENNIGQLKVSCNIEQYREHDQCNIEVILEGAFKFPNKETGDNESFLKLNGTTILMPYIRNIISMVTGYDTTSNHLLLPPVNVQQLFQD